MTNWELKNIIKEILKLKNQTKTSIAKNADVDRSYLSKMINLKDEKEMEDAFIEKISVAYPDYFKKQQNEEKYVVSRGTTKTSLGNIIEPVTKTLNLLPSLIDKLNSLTETQNRILGEQQKDVVEKIKDIRISLDTGLTRQELTWQAIWNLVEWGALLQAKGDSAKAKILLDKLRTKIRKKLPQVSEADIGDGVNK